MRYQMGDQLEDACAPTQSRASTRDLCTSWQTTGERPDIWQDSYWCTDTYNHHNVIVITVTTNIAAAIITMAGMLTKTTPTTTTVAETYGWLLGMLARCLDHCLLNGVLGTRAVHPSDALFWFLVHWLGCRSGD